LLTNLIGNAYKYGKENGEIKVELNVRNGKNHLSVTDNGIGISENEKEKVFMRFYRSDKSRNSDGTGLGLSLAMEIAKLHGGTITLESQMDKGSCFTFIF
jgi:signal transduction histidine kinase